MHSSHVTRHSSGSLSLIQKSLLGAVVSAGRDFSSSSRSSDSTPHIILPHWLIRGSERVRKQLSSPSGDQHDTQVAAQTRLVLSLSLFQSPPQSTSTSTRILSDSLTDSLVFSIKNELKESGQNGSYDPTRRSCGLCGRHGEGESQIPSSRPSTGPSSAL